MLFVSPSEISLRFPSDFLQKSLQDFFSKNCSINSFRNSIRSFSSKLLPIILWMFLMTFFKEFLQRYLEDFLKISSKYCFRVSLQKILKKFSWKTPELYLRVLPIIPSEKSAGVPSRIHPVIFVHFLQKKNQEESIDICRNPRRYL